MKKYCMWKDAEVKCLFDFVQEYNKSNKPLSQAFKDYAQKSGRKPNSVRNYYYLELSNLLENTSRAKKLDISLAWHSKKQAKFFSEEETDQAMKKIDELGKCVPYYRKRKRRTNGKIAKQISCNDKKITTQTIQCFDNAKTHQQTFGQRNQQPVFGTCTTCQKPSQTRSQPDAACRQRKSERYASKRGFGTCKQRPTNYKLEKAI